MGKAPLVCAREGEDTNYDLLNGILRKVRECQCCAERLAESGKKCIREMVGRDVTSDLPIQFLEAENKLGDSFMGSLFNGVELAE